MTVNIGPGFTTQPRCVNRKITDFLSAQTGTSYVNTAVSKKTYAEALDTIYSGPHLYGHMALSMMVSIQPPQHREPANRTDFPLVQNGDSITSPGDPLFIMHHGFVDKMWASWQSKDLEKRHTEMGGLNAQDPAVGFSEFPPDQESQSKMWGKPTAAMLAVTPDPQLGDNGKYMTLGHVLSSLGIIPNATVADIMDTKGGYLCYEYV
jgi:tyrosinase